jgi:hypothetical protein
MNINPYARIIEYRNDENDFRMPYQIYGESDKQIMLEKYMKLTNKPKSYLEKRYLQHQW